MTKNIGGMRRAASSLLHTMGITTYVADDSTLRGILREGILEILVVDVGGSSVPHHSQCVGGRSGPTLGSGDGRESRRARREQMGGKAPKLPVLLG